MLLNPSETVVGWIHHHTDSISCRTFNLKICNNMSVSGRLPARALWKPPFGKNCVDSNGRHSSQPDLLLYMTQGPWRTENYLSPLPQPNLAQDLEHSGCLIKVDWENKNWWNTYSLNTDLWTAKNDESFFFFFAFSQGKHLNIIKSFLFFLSENENTWLNSFHLSDLSG